MTKDLVKLVKQRYSLIECDLRKLDTLTGEQMIRILGELAADVRRSITDRQSRSDIVRDLHKCSEFSCVNNLLDWENHTQRKA